jgi:hypothetical protein
MELKRITHILIALIVAFILLFIGYMAGYRNYVNALPDEVEVNSPNRSTLNSLSNMQTKDVVGADSQMYGKMYFKESIEDNRTELLIELQGVPLNFKSQELNLVNEIPNQLEIKAAYINQEATNYEYETIGVISLNEPQDGLRTGRFTAVLSQKLGDSKEPIQRIILEPLQRDSGQSFIYKYTEKSGVPYELIGAPAPYFFILI